MNVEKINVGISPNDGTGDTIRESFIKVNQNFDVTKNSVEALEDFTGDISDDVQDLKTSDLSQKQDITNLKSSTATLTQGHTTQANQIVNIQDTMVKSVNNMTPDSNGNVNVVGGGSGGGIPEAPIDGVPYSRKDGNWTPAPDKGEVESELLFLSNEISQVETSLEGKVGDAPNDGKQYARQNEDWREVISSTEYELPIASSSVLGGVKVGSGLEIDSDGLLSTSGGGSQDLDSVLNEGNTSINSIRLDSDPEDFGDRSFSFSGDGIDILETSSGDVRGSFKGGYSYTEMSHLNTAIALYANEVDINKPVKISQATKDTQAPTLGQVKALIPSTADFVPEAPKNLNSYARSNGTWKVMPSIGLGMRGTRVYYLNDIGTSDTTQPSLDLRLTLPGSESNLAVNSTAFGVKTKSFGELGFVFGDSTGVTGKLGFAGGLNSLATADFGFTFGDNTRASGISSVSLGKSTESKGTYSTATGFWTESPEYAGTAIGMYSTLGTVRTSRVEGDNIFKIGIGTSSSARRDGFQVKNNGKVYAPHQTIALTTDPTQLVTKEYVDSIGGGGIPEAPSNGKLYGRKDEAWSEVTGGGGIPEAPSDGKLYGRKDEAWSEVTGGGGGSSTPIIFDTTKYAYYDELSTVSTVGNGSVAIGRLSATNPSTATGANATSIGSGSIATSPRAIALGFKPEASGPYAVAIGSQAKGTGTQAVGIGSNANALGSYAVSIGYNSKSASGALGQSAISIGYASNGNNKNTVAIGTSAIASNSDAIAIGSSSKCYGSIAIGKGSYSSGTSTTVVGDNSDAKGYRSSILGPDNINKYFGCTTVGVFSEGIVGDQGEYQRVVGSPSFIVGAGSSDSDRLNAFKVLNTGDAVLPIADSGVVLTSPNGTAFKLTVSDTGEPVFTAV